MGALERAQAARAAWPDVALPAEELVPLLEATDGKVSHDADLYLATACARGAAGAVEAFERTLLSQVPAYLHRQHLDAALLDEVKQLLRHKLFVGEAPKIAEYSGRGPLGGWLRVVALRTAIDLRRARGERHQAEVKEEQLADALGVPDELAYLKAEYRPLVKQAFQEAIGKLDGKERNLLRLHLVEGLTLEAIGRLFQVNRSTVLRWIGAARERLLEEARQVLSARSGVDAAEFESLVRLVRSGLDLSLSQVLKSQRSEPDEG